MGVPDVSTLLGDANETWIGSGLYRYCLEIRVRDGTVAIDPLPPVTVSSAHERPFRGTLRSGADGGAVLDGYFYADPIVRFVFFPALLVFSLAWVAICFSNMAWLPALLGLPFLYLAASYLIPGLLLGNDFRRTEAMVRDWLIMTLRARESSTS